MIRLLAPVVMLGVVAGLHAKVRAANGDRVLRFPAEQSLGVLWVRPADFGGLDLDGWERFGEAVGDVKVPAGKVVRLDVSRGAAKDLSPLRHEELTREHGDRFAMLSVSLDDVEQKHLARRHAERYGLAWSQACVGLEGDVVREYGVQGVARIVLIGPDGKVLLQDTNDKEELRQAVRKALAARLGGQPAR